MCGEEAHLRVSAFVQRNHHARMMMDLKEGDIIDVGNKEYEVLQITAQSPGLREFTFKVVGRSNQRGKGVMSDGGNFTCTITTTDNINHRKEWKIKEHKLAHLVKLNTISESTFKLIF